jgi:NitT/TauT family transport system permease protein/taurine transport system permease protein
MSALLHPDPAVPAVATPARSSASLSGTALAEQRRAARRQRWLRLAAGLCGLTGVVVAWEIAALVLHDPVTLPTVTATLSDLVKYLGTPYPTASDTLIGHALVSLRRVGLGFVLGGLAGLALGSAMASNRVVRYLVDPVLGVLRPVPPLAFIPLFVVWLGIGETAKVALITLGVAPIVTIATLGALDAVPREFEQASRALGAGTARTLALVRLRAALPGLIVGGRIALGAGWSAIIAAELVGATEGVGFVTLQAGNYLQTTLVLSGIVLIALLGLATDGVLRLALRFADPSTR